MTIEPMKPVALDWTQVEFVRVTLNKPWNGSGGLRFRCGHTPARKNLNYNAQQRGSKPYDAGEPIYWPKKEFKPIQPGESFIMPANSTRTISTRSGEAALDPTAHPVYTAFGWFNAPLQEEGITGFTLSAERERVCQFWGGYRMGPGDGTMHPPMVRTGAPNMPDVSLTLLDGSQQPILVDGEAVIIKPREFFYFDDPSQYTAEPERETAPAASTEMAELRAQVETLKSLLSVEVKPRGKAQQV